MKAPSHRTRLSPSLVCVAILALTGTAPSSAFAQATEPNAVPRRLSWTVDGLEREALVFAPAHAAKSPASENPLPVVFGFHGHGGNARRAAQMFGMHRHWPEALVVYMQGVPTPGRLTDPEGKRNGWQHDLGAQDDRDLKFFDAVLATLKQTYNVDANRIYSTGHSNGGGFTYLLWSTRPDVFAAVAPSAASSRRLHTLTPKPAMHIAGRQDQLVRFAWQERAIEAVKQINGCSEKGDLWAKDCTLYPSEKKAPFIAYIHGGTHQYPAEAPPLIVRFFKEQARPR